MFVYMITVIPINKVYIGLDTKPEYKKSRWKIHIKKSLEMFPKTKLHKAIKKYGVENCTFSVIENNFKSISDLAIAEIRYIEKFDSYRNGLNSTPGGDGLNTDLTKLDQDSLKIIRNSIGEHWRQFNVKKWTNKTLDERRELIKCCHTEDANLNRSITLKEYFRNIDEAKEKHTSGIKKWKEQNPDLNRKNALIGSKIGSEAVSKKLVVLQEDGTLSHYNSISEFQRKTGQWMCTVKKKSKNGLFHNGYLIKELNGKSL